MANRGPLPPGLPTLRGNSIGAIASGRSHDRATTALALPFGLLWGPALGWPGVVTAALAFLVGGLWLSPDLDTRSRATARWGPLALLWWPYRRLLSHRSMLSHSPLLGTAVRLGWLAALLLLGSALLAPLGSPSPAQLLARARALAGTRAPLLLAALVGLEASTWLHLLQDGDPMPRLPRLLRRNRRSSVLAVRRRRPSRR